ncbi:MAG: GIY-YIG nuclease family protein [Nitrospirota bacterium]|nr:GIY-YIG nuclease family protein [Nitrospirota bacterium]
MRYIDKLIENCQKAKDANSQREFVMNDISDLSGIDKAIYVIEQLDGDPEKTFIDFSRYKQSKARACAKINSPSMVMYVGSSTTGLQKRISQHLGDGNKNTYALHLKHWFNGKYKISIKVYNQPDAVLQIIEDDLSDRLKPAFGKQGGNNK